MTWEHELHFFLKRAQWNAHVPHPTSTTRARVAEMIGL